MKNNNAKLRKELTANLLCTNLFIQNEYFNKYVALIISNRHTKKEKFKTQLHHIIPRCYYKFNGLKVDNSQYNTVNLSHKDHAIAHYYLSLCTNDNDFKYANVNAILHILGNSNYLLNPNHDKDVQVIKRFEEYNYLMEFMLRERSRKYKGINKGVNISEEQKSKISKVNSGLMYINKDNITIKISPADLPSYLEQGWVIGNHSKKTSKGIYHNTGASALMKSKDGVIITNGLITKIVSKSDFINKFQNEGWRIGRSKTLEWCDLSKDQQSYIRTLIINHYGVFMCKENLPQRIKLVKNNETKKIKTYALYNYLLDGWFFIDKKVSIIDK